MLWAYPRVDGYERLLKTAMAEFECEVRRLVEREIEPLLKTAQPGDEIPYIGGRFPPREFPEAWAEVPMRVGRAAGSVTTARGRTCGTFDLEALHSVGS
jgi:hypothetical protein